MSIFRKTNAGGFMDEIRCDIPDYLIWKWHPNGSEAGNNNRENAIRWGSSLRVKDGEVAVFVYNQRNGIFQDFIEGPYDEKIKTANLPVIAKIIGLAYDGGTPFQAEVYFINLAKIVQAKIAVPFFDVFDPRFPDFSVPVAVRGTLNFKISNYKEFIKFHRLIDFSLDDFQTKISSIVNRYVKNTVINIPMQKNIPVIQLESQIEQINIDVKNEISNRLANDFGVDITGIDIAVIDFDKSSPGYSHLMTVTKDVTEAKVKAKTSAEIKNIHDIQRIQAENYKETLRIQREEAQYAKHKQTQTEHLAAYQTEAQTSIGVAAAEALGKMETNGAGGVNLGNSGGFNPSAMMAGMALGGAVGQNLAGTINNAMSGLNSQVSSPPPVPSVKYYVAVNGKPTGPFDINILSQMKSNGSISSSSLMWTEGMIDWTKAGEIEGLNKIFNENIVPPPIK